MRGAAAQGAVEPLDAHLASVGRQVVLDQSLDEARVVVVAAAEEPSEETRTFLLDLRPGRQRQKQQEGNGQPSQNACPMPT